ncbi:MAG: hypothetical protein LKM32_06630 [Chiayiivirga sp.]|jgi:hypothetical protein|uniref:hypothetical protein n=1 Tax=Chiayiivirga sp. TaxID=2041042 RepID=UPI0025BC6CD0|nr:hypothetical protein [Chiayiivirga sp.]MCI1710152.1 hypothetical protein [Chiayiivirga sp.]MCI1729053.1 hypothetical protein [Chiayiivirga sp.]
MLHRLRRQCIAARTCWLALLLLAVVWQPSLLAASQVHASEHLIQTGHAHDADHDGPGIPADEQVTPGNDTFWHGLMHLAHCCGQVSALPAAPLLVTAASHDALAPEGPRGVLATHAPPQPLRPPIRG